MGDQLLIRKHAVVPNHGLHNYDTVVAARGAMTKYWTGRCSRAVKSMSSTHQQELLHYQLASIPPPVQETWLIGHGRELFYRV